MSTYPHQPKCDAALGLPSEEFPFMVPPTRVAELAAVNVDALAQALSLERQQVMQALSQTGLSLFKRP